MKFMSLCIVLLASVAIADTGSDLLLGQYWLPEKDGQLEIYEQGNRYFGRVISYDVAGQMTKNTHTQGCGADRLLVLTCSPISATTKKVRAGLKAQSMTQRAARSTSAAYGLKMTIPVYCGPAAISESRYSGAPSDSSEC